MEAQSSSQKKRPASPEHNNPTKKRKTKYNKATVSLTERFASSMKDLIATTHNEDFRQQCLKTLQVNNGSEAGKKIEELLEAFKANKKGKSAKEGSEKINEKSS